MSSKTLLFTLGALALAACDSPTEPKTVDAEAMVVGWPTPQPMPRLCPDLVVDSILQPTWDAGNHRSVITAMIRNAGYASAPSTIARVIDPSTLGPTGPQSAIATTPALGPGAVATVTFYLPYWVFNPNATLEVTADYNNQLAECREDNNVRNFEMAG